MATEVKTMELKKTPTPAATKDVATKSWSIVDFVGDIKDEFSKITWTSSEELRTYTKLVVGATFLLGMSIYFVDFTIQAVLNILGFLFRSIFG